ncbi:hypothetical protein F0562_001895 [Nyssa sinensis]|uniref:Uncharacterized protein n=1 Tax=Nyssa sinensis TaxID=561372 RepID=A0A5J5C9C9_9ASTE|nr:hypothetical protein F0562_001895 [Nyssa sinensis]
MRGFQDRPSFVEVVTGGITSLDIGKLVKFVKKREEDGSKEYDKDDDTEDEVEAKDDLKIFNLAKNLVVVEESKTIGILEDYVSVNAAGESKSCDRIDNEFSTNNECFAANLNLERREGSEFEIDNRLPNGLFKDTSGSIGSLAFLNLEVGKGVGRWTNVYPMGL